MPVDVVCGARFGAGRMVRRKLGGKSFVITITNGLTLATCEADAFLAMLARLRSVDPKFRLEPVDVSAASAPDQALNLEDMIYTP